MNQNYLDTKKDHLQERSQQRIGKFELANKGTIFLDEIGDMSLQAQAKVLRAIEDGKIERVGGGKKIEVDVRIISATNKDLTEEIRKRKFQRRSLSQIKCYSDPYSAT